MTSDEEPRPARPIPCSVPSDGAGFPAGRTPPAPGGVGAPAPSLGPRTTFGTAQPSPGEDPMTGEDVMVGGETEQLRQQLLHAQRLSSVGALAASVAHEFNNILTTIINYAKLGMRPEGDEAARVQALEKILKGSQRAATIVNSMLGFTRNHSSQRQVVDIVRLVEDVLVLTDKDFSKHRVRVETNFHGRPQA